MDLMRGHLSRSYATWHVEKIKAKGLMLLMSVTSAQSTRLLMLKSCILWRYNTLNEATKAHMKGLLASYHAAMDSMVMDHQIRETEQQEAINCYRKQAGSRILARKVVNTLSVREKCIRAVGQMQVTAAEAKFDLQLGQFQQILIRVHAGAGMKFLQRTMWSRVKESKVFALFNWRHSVARATRFPTQLPRSSAY